MSTEAQAERLGLTVALDLMEREALEDRSMGRFYIAGTGAAALALLLFQSFAEIPAGWDAGLTAGFGGVVVVGAWGLFKVRGADRVLQAVRSARVSGRFELLATSLKSGGPR